MIWLNACCTKWGRRYKIRERVKQMWTRQNKSVQNWSFSTMVSNVWPLDLLPHDVLLTAERWRCTHFNGPLCEGKPPTSVPEVKLWLWARSRASRRNRGSGGSRVCARARNRVPPRTRASFLLRGNASSLVRRCRRWTKRLAGGHNGFKNLTEGAEQQQIDRVLWWPNS